MLANAPPAPQTTAISFSSRMVTSPTVESPLPAAITDAGGARIPRVFCAQKQVRFKGEDFFHADIREASVVTLYLLSAANGHLGPRLASQLAKGSRVVCLDYEVPRWRFMESKAIKSEGNVDYTIYLYRR